MNKGRRCEGTRLFDKQKQRDETEPKAAFKSELLKAKVSPFDAQLRAARTDP